MERGDVCRGIGRVNRRWRRKKDKFDNSIYLTSIYFVYAAQLVGGEDGKAERGLHPLDIDAFWLQRNLNKHYNDPVVTQSKSQEVLGVLQVSKKNNAL